MEIIGLFFPAMVSVLVWRKKNREVDCQAIDVICRYGVYVLANVLLTEGIITYGLGISGVTADALNSFPFFMKYTLIALVMSVLVPYAEMIIRKYIRITLTVRTYDEKEEDSMEKH